MYCEVVEQQKNVKWSVSNKNIKIISKNNEQAKIRGVKKGSAYINAKVGSKTYKCKITVNPNPKFSPSKKSIKVGDSTTIKILNAKGKVKWSVSNGIIRIVKSTNRYAKIEGRKAGTAYLNAKVDGKTYKCKVTVKEKVIIKEELDKKIQILAEYTLPDSIGWYTRHFMVIKNTSNVTVDISTSSIAYAPDGTMVSAADASFIALGSGCTSVMYEAFETDKEIGRYSTKIKATESKYNKSVIQGLSNVKNDIAGGAIFQVTNNGKEPAKFV